MSAGRHFAPLLLLVFGGGATANDTSATLSAGGLVFVQSEDVRLLSEDLYLSMDEVRVRYEFRNEGSEDRRTLVAFPLPDITGSPDLMVSIPTEDPENIFGFTTLFDGEPLEAELHRYAFAHNLDFTELLVGMEVPLAPFGEATLAAIAALSDAQRGELLAKGLIVPLEFDAGQGWQTEYYPVWTLRSTYAWEAEFPAGDTVTVEHSYKPSVGGTVAVTFLAPPYEGYDPASDYAKKYCTDESFLNAVRRTLPDSDEPYGAPFTESWLSYVWSTGANWAGPIGRFHLTIEKGAPENLVSFCWDGEVTKTSPTTFEMSAEDWYPPWDRELEVLILQRRQDEAGLNLEQ
ncbi:MAG TPA: DUF4424 domain-containing protein [Devosiaceae bacterium]|jgi:hypothetical protein|nr:DUF4424 domain-containing protein [Devosiaceae bacterium]